MQDTELYRQLLGLEPPWKVIRVELAVKDKRVDVWADHETRVRLACPECGRDLPVYDHAEERSWRPPRQSAVPHLPARPAAAGRLPRARHPPGGAAVG